MEMLVGAGAVVQSGRSAAGRRVGTARISGGARVPTVDAWESSGLDVSEPPADVGATVSGSLSALTSSRNPMDVTGGMVNDLGMPGNVIEAGARIPTLGDPTRAVRAVAVLAGNSPLPSPGIRGPLLSGADR